MRDDRLGDRHDARPVVHEDRAAGLDQLQRGLGDRALLLDVLGFAIGEVLLGRSQRLHHRPAMGALDPERALQVREVAADAGWRCGDEGAQFLDRQGPMRQEKPFDLALPLGRIALNLGHNLQYTSQQIAKQSLTVT